MSKQRSLLLSGFSIPHYETGQLDRTSIILSTVHLKTTLLEGDECFNLVAAAQNTKIITLHIPPTPSLIYYRSAIRPIRLPTYKPSSNVRQN